MKHRLISALLCVGLLLTLLPAASAASAFSDVSDSATQEAVAVLSGMGIVSGYSDGAYHPNDVLTRAQFCKLAILLENKGDEAAVSGYRSLFSDLPATHWAVGYVNLAYSDGLVAGYGNGRFGPDDPVTCAQAVTVLLHVLGYQNDDIGPFWPEDYMSRAAKLGLTDGIGASAGQALTRGQAARLLLAALNQDTADGKTYLSTWAASTVTSALVMDNDGEADDGRSNTAEIYAKDSVSWYDQTNPISGALVGRRGTLLLDETGKVAGFVPEENVWKAVAIASVDASGITDTGGKTYDVSSSTAVLLNGEEEAWSSCWYDLEGQGTARLYYSDSGSIDLVYVGAISTHTDAAVAKSKNAALSDLTGGLGISGSYSLYKNGAAATADDLAQYDVGVYDSATGSLRVSDVKLTGVYEDASPNTEDPSTITVMGVTLPVLDQAQSSLRAFSIGDRITVLLTADGQVAQAVSASTVSADALGILDSVSGETAKVTLYNGLTAQGTVSGNLNTVSQLVGGVVKVTSNSTGTLSLSAVSAGSTGKLNVTAGTVGALKLAPKVWIYDRTGKTGTAVEEDLDDLTISAVASGSVGYVRTNQAGQADLLVLEDVTGDCYTYGYLKSGTQSGGSGSMSYTNKTASVENSTGTHGPYVTGISVVTGQAGGIAVSNSQVTAAVTLTAAGDVARSDFDGEDTVVADGYTIPISDDVQVYNETTDTWTTLGAAKAFSSTFTVYYDKTPTTGGKVRLIVAES